jgi:hypothetical protein
MVAVAGQRVSFRAANGILATQSKTAQQLRIADRLADSLSAGPPDRCVNSTPFLAKWQTRRPARDTNNGVACLLWVETKQLAGHLLIANCGVGWRSRHVRGRTQLFIAEHRYAHCAPFEATKALLFLGRK